MDISGFLQKEPQRLHAMERQEAQGKPPKPWHPMCCPICPCLFRSWQRNLLVKLQKGCLQLLGAQGWSLMCPHGVLGLLLPKVGQDIDEPAHLCPTLTLQWMGQGLKWKDLLQDASTSWLFKDIVISVFLSIYLSIYLSIFLSIYLFWWKKCWSCGTKAFPESDVFSSKSILSKTGREVG